MAYSTAILLTTGKVPGMPAHTGQTAVFGAACVRSTTWQAQNIFDLVCSSAWTSSPMTGSNSVGMKFLAGCDCSNYIPIEKRPRKPVQYKPKPGTRPGQGL